MFGCPSGIQPGNLHYSARPRGSSKEVHGGVLLAHSVATGTIAHVDGDGSITPLSDEELLNFASLLPRPSKLS